MSTALSELAQQVTSGIERLGRRDELRTQLRSLDAVREAIDRLLKRLNALAGDLSPARQAGFAPLMPDVTGTARSLGKLAAQLQAGEVDREYAQQVIDAVDGLLRTVQSSLDDAWRGYVISRVPMHEGLAELADTFRTIRGARGKAQELQNAARSVVLLLERQPSADAIEKLQQLAQQIPALLRELVGDDPAVRKFADQLARGGASIEALTPPVLSWMQDKEFINSFRIIPGRPAGEAQI
jgi:hypothetical protein